MYGTPFSPGALSAIETEAAFLAFRHGARFFFHLYDDAVVLDPEGRELPDAAAAEEEAIRSAREMACAEVVDGHLGLNRRIEVTDAHDAPVTTVRFKDVVKLHP